jgi:hypothetical protein
MSGQNDRATIAENADEAWEMCQHLVAQRDVSMDKVHTGTENL